MLRAAATVASIVGVSAVLSGQIQMRPPASGTGLISGRVIDARTGAPIGAARVQMYETNAPIGRQLRFATTNTDEAGRFVFHDLPASQFNVTAGADGYLDGAAGKRRPQGRSVSITLADGEEFTSLKIELTGAARIRGQVLDETGAPIAGVPVEAWRRDLSRKLEIPSRTVPSARTNADGMYELRDVPPGDYVVTLPVTRATWRMPLTPPPSCAPPPPPPPPGVVASKAPLVPEKPQHEPGSIYSEILRGYKPTEQPGKDSLRHYATIFFPGRTDPALASTLRVDSGDIRTDVNFRLESVPVTTVRGQLTRPSGIPIGNATTVTLRRIGAPGVFPDQPDDVSTFADANQRFTFLDVPTGRYMLEVAIGVASGSCDVGPIHYARDIPTRIPVEVTAEGIDDLVVPLGEGYELNGRIAFHGSGLRPFYVDIGATSENGRSHASNQSNNESFTMVGLTPGRWILQASENGDRRGWRVESMTLDGHDLTVEPFEIGAVNRSGAIITMTNEVTSVTGQVFDGNGKPVDDATVVAFPVDRNLWPSADQQLMRFSTARALGSRYAFTRFIAGEYFFTAVDERRMDDWPSAAFLESIQAGASKIRVSSGEHLTLALTMR